MKNYKIKTFEDYCHLTALLAGSVEGEHSDKKVDKITDEDGDDCYIITIDHIKTVRFDLKSKLNYEFTQKILEDSLTMQKAIINLYNN